MVGSCSNRLSIGESKCRIFWSNLELAFFEQVSQNSCIFRSWPSAAVIFVVVCDMFGAVLVLHGYVTVARVVFCEGCHSAVMRSRGLSFSLLRLRPCHCDFVSLFVWRA